MFCESSSLTLLWIYRDSLDTRQLEPTTTVTAIPRPRGLMQQINGGHSFSPLPNLTGLRPRKFHVRALWFKIINRSS